MNGWFSRWIHWLTLITVLFGFNVLVPNLITSQQPSSPTSTPTPLPSTTVSTVPPDEQVSPDTPPERPDTETNHTIRLSGDQGVVTLDVQMPSTVRPDQEFEYTYIYKNTSATQTFDNINIEVVWVDFSVEPGSQWQYCADSCGVKPGSVQGPGVFVKEEVNNSGRGWFSIGSLAPGEEGQFSVMMKANKSAYPKTGETIARPSGTGRLFIGDQLTSEDTQNTMIVGPVFVLTKEASKSNAYPLEASDFTITLGNATGPDDTEDGKLRPDAIAAHNIVVVDTFPAGSDFVTASKPSGGSYNVDRVNKKVTWTISGRTLEPGQEITLDVTYKKRDEAVECDKMTNKTYTVTSDEMPFKEGSTRYTVAGSAASMTILDTVRIKSISASPANISFGDTTTINIVIENLYNRSISSAELAYTLPNNVTYVSADPPLSTNPPQDETGVEAVWRNITIPEGSSKTLKLTVRGSDAEGAGSNGTATLTVGGSVPAACSTTTLQGGKVTLKPRLTITKTRTSEKLVVRGEQASYTIEVNNVSSNAISNVTVSDVLPGETLKDACFTYVDGSARVDGQQKDPTVQSGTLCGELEWRNLSIPAGDNLVISYNVLVDGFDYVEYCTKASVTLGSEAFSYTSKDVCTKLNPDIEVKKVVNQAVADPGEAVQFTISLTNHESEMYKVGLFDLLGKFESPVQISGYDDFVEIEEQYMPDTEGRKLLWPLYELQPGETIEAVIEAQVNAACPDTEPYVNELLFHIESLGETYAVVPVPRVKKEVTYTRPPGCVAPTATPTNTPVPGAPVTPTPTSTPVPNYDIEYSKEANRKEASLKDDVIYTLTIKNTTNTGETVKDLRVVDTLPQRFSFVGIEATSNVTSTPVIEPQENTQTDLIWTVPSLEAGEEVKIIYRSVSGDIVGTYSGSMRVETPEGWSAVAEGDITTPITVKPLVTMVPQMLNVPSPCAEQGDQVRYRVTLVSTNIRAYDDIAVSIHLPLGLKYVDMIDSPTIPEPRVTTGGDGITTLSWKDLHIPKPDGKTFAQTVIEVNLEIGNVWGDLEPEVEASTTLEGAIPIKEADDEQDSGPIITTANVCDPLSPAFGKEVDNAEVVVGSTVVYQISLVNTTEAPLTDVSVEDILPDNIAFVKMIGDDPAPELQPHPTTDTPDRRLVWENLTVPGTEDGEQIAIRTLQYQAQVTAGEIGQSYTNAATVAPTERFVPATSFATVTVENPGVVIISSEDPYLFTTILNTSKDICEEQGKELTYQISLMNPDTEFSYEHTSVFVELPAGLKYRGMLYTNLPPDLHEPQILSNGDGSSTLLWEGITLPRSPGSEPSHIAMLIRLEIGQVWGTLSPTTTALSTGTVVNHVDTDDDTDNNIITVCSPSPSDGPSMTKEVDRTRAVTDTMLVYQISLANPGETALTDVVVEDVLPDTMVFVKMLAGGPQPVVEPSGGDSDGQRLVWSGLDVPGATDTNPAGLKVLKYQVHMVSGTVGESYENSASVTSSEPFVPDTDTATVTVAGRPTPPKDVPYLTSSLLDTSSTECVEQGAQLTYQLRLLNPTNENHDNLKLSIALPVGLKYLEATGARQLPLVKTSGDGLTTLTWDDLTIDKGTEEKPTKIVINVQLQVGMVWDTLHPVATASLPSQTIPTYTWGPDGEEYNTVVEVCPPPAPAVGKEVDHGSREIGDTAVYQITLVNNKPEDISGIMLEDMLPENIEFVEMVGEAPFPDLRPNLDTGTPDKHLMWNNLSVPAREDGELVATTILQYKVRLASGEVGESYTNTVTVTAIEEFDPATSSATITAIDTPDDGVAYIVDSISQTTASAGCFEHNDELTYDVKLYSTNTVRDFGETTVIVKLPMGLKYVGLDTTTGDVSVPAPSVTDYIDGSTWLVWDSITLPKMMNGLPVVVEFPVRLKVGQVWGNLTPTTTASSPQTTIFEQENGDTTIEPVVNICSIPPDSAAIGKEVGATDVVSGSAVMYHISLANTTGNDITDVTVEDMLPEGAEFITMIGSDIAPLIETDPISPTLNRRLVWRNITVPAAEDGEAMGLLTLKYKLRIFGEVDKSYPNTAEVTSDQGFNPSSSSATVTVVGEDSQLPPAGGLGGPPYFVFLPTIHSSE